MRSSACHPGARSVSVRKPRNNQRCQTPQRSAGRNLDHPNSNSKEPRLALSKSERAESLLASGCVWNWHFERMCHPRPHKHKSAMNSWRVMTATKTLSDAPPGTVDCNRDATGAFAAAKVRCRLHVAPLSVHFLPIDVNGTIRRAIFIFVVNDTIKSPCIEIQ